MKSVFFVTLFFSTFVVFTAAGARADLRRESPQTRNSITGFVFNEARRPVSDVWVELQSDVYSTIARTKTTGSGQYAFRGLRDGNYYVKVLPYGVDYEGQTRSVALVSISAIPGSGGISEQVDFYLRPKKNANSGPLAAPGVVFAQEVPADAQKLYEAGVDDLRDKKDQEGLEKIKKSIEIFPQYYLALDRLGTEYVVRGHYRPGYVLLQKALEVNPKSFSSTFGLGLAQFRLQELDPAIENLKRATELYGESINAYMWLGIALHGKSKYSEAQAALIKANKLGKGEVAEVHYQLARVYKDQNRFKEAADELELFLEHSSEPGDVEALKQTIKRLREKAGT